MTQPLEPAAFVPLRSRAREALEAAWERATASGALPQVAPIERPAIEVERPANPEHGDLSSNLAMKLARPCRMAPLRIAEALAAELTADAGRSRLHRRGRDASPRPASSTCGCRTRRSPTSSRRSWRTPPRGAASRPRRRSESTWSSCRPTRPGRSTSATRAARSSGDLLCRVLEAAGHTVTREYYFNDFGAQVRNLGASVVAIRRGEPLPEEAYRGAYVGDLATEIPDDVWSAAQAADADPVAIVGQWASERVRAGIEESLAHLGVRFDVWKSEGSLYRDGWVARAVERLEAAGALYEDDGALWFRSTSFGDDKDRVVRKSNGDWTYFGSDVGYVVEKFSRGFDRLVYIWGADHHGTVARLRNAAAAMGYDRDAVQMILMAWVRFVRDGVEVSMSKRSGEFITLDELLAEIGVDAARWFFAARAAHVGHRLRHRAGEEAVGREPRLLRPVRARPDRLDPPQGGRGGAGARRVRSAPAGARRRAGGRPGPGDRALPGGRGGRGRRRGDPRDHRLRDRPRDRSSTPSTATRGWSTRPSRSAPRPASRWCARRS